MGDGLCTFPRAPNSIPGNPRHPSLCKELLEGFNEGERLTWLPGGPQHAPCPWEPLSFSPAPPCPLPTLQTPSDSLYSVSEVENHCWWGGGRPTCLALALREIIKILSLGTWEKSLPSAPCLPCPPALCCCSGLSRGRASGSSCELKWTLSCEDLSWTLFGRERNEGSLRGATLDLRHSRFFSLGFGEAGKQGL